MMPSRMTSLRACGLCLFLLVAFTILSGLWAQSGTSPTDPGPRPTGSNQPLAPINDQFGNTIVDTAQVPPSDLKTPCTNSPISQKQFAGCFLPNLNGAQIGLWFDGLAVFGDLASVKGTPKGPNSAGVNGEPLPGLGAYYNGNSCGMCHSQPAIGGSSPGVGTPGFTINPQFAVATHRGANNTPPVFVNKNNGPIAEERFVLAVDSNGNPTSSLDGSVHNLYTIEGRGDAPAGCNQPQLLSLLNGQFNNNNAILRIPTPTFGLGLVETTPDSELQENLNASQALGFNTGGRFNTTFFNTSGNDQTITRFGWKAQNVSLLMFAGEASNVELNITNVLFPFERNEGTCTTNQTPEDFTLTDAPPPSDDTDGTNVVNPEILAPDVEAEAFFMFTNAAPAQCDFSSPIDPNTNAPKCLTLSQSAQNGLTVFNQLGCQSCHTQTLTTGPSAFTDLNNQNFQPFSDFALHHMGSKLADGVNQGQAGPDEFRTAPLWGLGQRFFLLHDGRTQDLMTAIQDHFSPTSNCTTVTSISESFILNGSPITVQPVTTQTCGSDANTVITNFRNLLQSNPQDIQDLFNFLRSL